MKKKAIITLTIMVVLVAIIVVILLVRISSNTDHITEQKGTMVTFSAFILEIRDTFLIVEPVIGSWELNSSDKIEVSLRDVTLPEGAKVGDMIEIDHDGMILETYPARLNRVYDIGMAETIDFNQLVINRNDLSKTTLIWLEQYNNMSEIDQMSISSVPQELVELNIAYYQRNPLPPSMVMIDGELYYDTGEVSIKEERKKGYDGKITSFVAGNEIPTENNQANFDAGVYYQYGDTEGTIDIFMHEQWWVFSVEN